ncbi:MAG: TIGR01458 family HAD-type hydrolase [Caldithrix sp.]|nr:TIGR01458 family HAD-type hydrolase [Caldithrix sp.]
MKKKIKGLLIDLDGVIYNDSTPIRGSVKTVQWLINQSIPFRFITNTTMKSRSTLQLKLNAMGISVSKEHIFSAAYAAAKFVKQNKGNGHLLMLEDAKTEFAGLADSTQPIDYVVVGDIGNMLSFDKLNDAFVHLINGAQLIAMQKNRFWLSDQGYKIDAGAFVALLEFAANKEAILIGKPQKRFFQMALQDLQLDINEVAMIGDDIESDIGGAKQVGLFNCLVKTGKFREHDLIQSALQPDMVLNSIADLRECDFL